MSNEKVLPVAGDVIHNSSMNPKMAESLPDGTILSAMVPKEGKKDELVKEVITRFIDPEGDGWWLTAGLALPLTDEQFASLTIQTETDWRVVE